MTNPTRECWKGLYEIEAAQFVNQIPAHDLFTGEEVHAHVRSKIGDPDTPNLWGCCFRKLINEKLEAGHVIVTGIKKSVRASNHSHFYRQYKKTGN